MITFEFKFCAAVDASAVVLNGTPSYGTFYYSVILEGDGKTLDSTDNSQWTLPKTALFVHSGLDLAKKYTLRFRNWSDTHPNCPTGPDGNHRYCCQSFDSLKLIGSAMRFSGCVDLQSIYTTYSNLSKG